MQSIAAAPVTLSYLPSAPSRSLATLAVEPQAEAIAETAAKGDPVIRVRELDFFYGETRALHDITLDVPRRQVTAFIGPSGCGKSTLLRCFNRMNDKVEHARVTRGSIEVEGRDVHSPEVNPAVLRRQVGMVFQKSNPFPQSIYENVAYGLRIGGERRKEQLDQMVEESLRGAALWDEVRDRLAESAFGLSGGQQQRLCIARAIAVRPRIILMDEPCSALDPISTAKVEDLITRLKQDYTIVIVTHNMQQATRVSDRTAFFLLGRLIEHGPTEQMFNTPKAKETEDYISGRFG